MQLFASWFNITDVMGKFCLANRGPKHIQYFLDDKSAARVHRMAVWAPQLEGINNSLPVRLFKL